MRSDHALFTRTFVASHHARERAIRGRTICHSPWLWIGSAESADSIRHAVSTLALKVEALIVSVSLERWSTSVVRLH